MDEWLADCILDQLARLPIPGWSHCTVFLGKLLNSYSASLQSGAGMCTREVNTGGNPVMDKDHGGGGE